MVRRLDRRDGFENLFDHMQDFFDQFQHKMNKEISEIGGTFPVDIKEEDGNVTITADMPGVEKENINLKADEEKIEISAESSEEYQEENEKYFRRERASRAYMRTVAWPTRVNPDTIHAEYSEGVLKITAEKDQEEGRDIEIE